MVDFNVHVYEKVPGTVRELRLVRTNPWVRLAVKDQPPVFIQGGKIQSEDGKAYDPVPEWVPAEIAKLGPVVRQEVGLRDDPLPAKEPIIKPQEDWTCPAVET